MSLLQARAYRFVESTCKEGIERELNTKMAAIKAKDVAVYMSPDTDAHGSNGPMLTVASVYLPLSINFLKLANTEPLVAQYAINEPSKCIDVLVTAALDVQKSILCEKKDSSMVIEVEAENLLFKATQMQVLEKDNVCTPLFQFEGFTIRFKSFVTPSRALISLCTNDIGKFVSICGIVSAVSEKKVILVERDYLCTKCHKVTRVCADVAQRYRLQAPHACQYCLSMRKKSNFELSRGKRNPEPVACKESYEKHSPKNKFHKAFNGETFQQIDEQKERWMDFQEIKISERQVLGNSSEQSLSTKYVTVVLQRDLVDTISVGEEVGILAIPTMQWLHPVSHGAACIPRMVFFANDITLLAPKKETPYEAIAGALISRQHIVEMCRPTDLRLRDEYIESLFPDVHGQFSLKLAIVLVLIGGCPRDIINGVKRRSACHLLLHGPPCTGKTMLLQQAHYLSVQKRQGKGGVMITGTGTSVAGLTAAAVRESGEGEATWNLEAGALVLSNEGVCCIDDFHKLTAPARMSLLEAMEQQHVSVAKAGVLCSLSARCSVIAAATKASSYTDDLTASNNHSLDIDLPLLSRFDLIFAVNDSKDTRCDEDFVTFFLNCREKTLADNLCVKSAYIRYAASQRTSDLPDKLKFLLLAYYEHLKKDHLSNHRFHLPTGESPMTIRTLESLIRLTQAHAKLMGHPTPVAEDVLSIIWLFEQSILGTGILKHVPAGLSETDSNVFEWLQWALQNDNFLSKFKYCACITSLA